MRAGRIVSGRPDSVAEPAAGALPDPPQTTTPSNPIRGLQAALVWGGLGFLAGAVFWHLVGFWSFVSDVVLDRTPAAHASVAVPPPPRTVPPKVVLIDADRCTALALDRRSKLTMARPCPKNGLALRLEPENGRREDLTVLARPHLQAAGYRAD